MNQRDRILFFDGRLYRAQGRAERAFADAMANGEMGHVGREMPRHGQVLTLLDNFRPYKYVMMHWSIPVADRENVHMKWYVLCFEGRMVERDEFLRFVHAEQQALSGAQQNEKTPPPQRRDDGAGHRKDDLVG